MSLALNWYLLFWHPWCWNQIKEMLHGWVFFPKYITLISIFLFRTRFPLPFYKVHYWFRRVAEGLYALWCFQFVGIIPCWSQHAEERHYPKLICNVQWMYHIWEFGICRILKLKPNYFKKQCFSSSFLLA